jgi:serine/threonine protein kinase
LVTDICKGDNLFDHYIKHKDNFCELDCLRVIRSVLKGLAYLEKKEIIHRDIKPANIVLKEENDIDNCTIIDFG